MNQLRFSEVLYLSLERRTVSHKGYRRVETPSLPQSSISFSTSLFTDFKDCTAHRHKSRWQGNVGALFAFIQSSRPSETHSRLPSISRTRSIEAPFPLADRHHGNHCADVSLVRDWSVSGAIKIRNYYGNDCADVGFGDWSTLSCYKAAGNHSNGYEFCALLENHKEKSK